MQSLIKLGMSFIVSFALALIILSVFVPRSGFIIALSIVIPTLLINYAVDKLKINVSGALTTPSRINKNNLRYD